jgi:hypothetical protein
MTLIRRTSPWFCCRTCFAELSRWTGIGSQAGSPSTSCLLHSLRAVLKKLHIIKSHKRKLTDFICGRSWKLFELGTPCSSMQSGRFTSSCIRRRRERGMRGILHFGACLLRVVLMVYKLATWDSAKHLRPTRATTAMVHLFCTCPSPRRVVTMFNTWHAYACACANIAFKKQSNSVVTTSSDLYRFLRSSQA